MNKKLIAIFIIVAVAAGVATYYLWPSNENLAATVNDEQIEISTFEDRVSETTAMYEMYGMDVTDEMLQTIQQDTLEQLIAETLLMQNAAQAGFEATAEQVDQEYQDILAQFETEDALLEALDQQGHTIEDLKEDIKVQLSLQQYIDDYVLNNVADEQLAVSEDEVAALYDQYSQMQEDLPSLEEMHSDLEQEVYQRKLNTVIQELITILKSESEIEKFI